MQRRVDREQMRQVVSVPVREVVDPFHPHRPVHLRFDRERRRVVEEQAARARRLHSTVAPDCRRGQTCRQDLLRELLHRDLVVVDRLTPPNDRVCLRRGQTVDYYEISMKQFAQQILPAGLPATTVWGYGAVKSASASGLLLHNAPSLTIEAQVNRPVRVKWINDLQDADGNYLPHL